MSTLVLINIAIEISCSVICLVIMACIVIGDSLAVRINRAFIWVLLSNAALMLSDAMAFYCIGRTEPHFFITSSEIFLHSSSAMLSLCAFQITSTFTWRPVGLSLNFTLFSRIL